MRISILAIISLLAFSTLSAQNTLDGQAKIVPEAEVERQSNFVNAERERLLGHFDKAIELYKKFTYDNPDVAAAWYGLARTYVSKTRPCQRAGSHRQSGGKRTRQRVVPDLFGRYL
jgi:tetratricopeptide (TPR) repeat protein